MRIHVLLGETAGMFGTFTVGSILAWVVLHGSMDGLLFIGISLALVAVIAVHLRGRMRSLRLLRLGRVSYGTLVAKEAVPRRNWQDDSPQKYRLSFRFEDRGETYTITTRTAYPRLLEDDHREQLVFMANDPRGAELVDALPGRPRIREDNTISPSDHAPGATLALMMLAGALIVEAVSAYLWLR